MDDEAFKAAFAEEASVAPKEDYGQMSLSEDKFRRIIQSYLKHSYKHPYTAGLDLNETDDGKFLPRGDLILEGFGSPSQNTDGHNSASFLLGETLCNECNAQWGKCECPVGWGKRDNATKTSD
jgi:hypothetical protein